LEQEVLQGFLYPHLGIFQVLFSEHSALLPMGGYQSITAELAGREELPLPLGGSSQLRMQEVPGEQHQIMVREIMKMAVVAAALRLQQQPVVTEPAAKTQILFLHLAASGQGMVVRADVLMAIPMLPPELLPGAGAGEKAKLGDLLKAGLVVR
jgi:hypothetical protein